MRFTIPEVNNMRIENNIYNRSYNYNRYKQSNTANTPAFTGLGIKSLNFSRAININKDKHFLDECFLISDKLGITYKLLSSIIGEKVPDRRFQFVRQLANSYNAQNFSKKIGEKEDSSNVMYIIRDIVKPESEHFNIVQKSDMPFETLHSIFSKAKSKGDLGFVQAIQHDVLDGSKESADIILKMLKSPYKETYTKNIQDYKSYLKLNSQKETCVEDLDKLLQSGKYDKAAYDHKLMFEKMLKHRKINTIISRYGNFIENNLTKDNERFIRHFCEDFLSYRKAMSEEDYIDVLKMFKSTTDKNVNTRIRIIDKFKHNYSEAETGVSDIRAMKNLFAHMDSNPHKAAFVEKALNGNIKIESIENLNTILSVVPPKKAEIFYKNIVRIVRYTKPEERESALLTEIENPFFPTKRIDEKIKRDVITSRVQKDSNFEKLTKYFENKLNIRRYSKITEDIPQPLALQEEPLILTPVTSSNESKISLSKTLKSAPKARKLQVKSDVNDIIKKKLGQKTYDKQADNYDAKATAMRLKMLPDIFESISATRKLQRAAGKRPNVENKDAVALYERIKGKNRKLVRYMLKQTDSENNRIFNLKEIIKLIDNAEAKIAQNKKANPQYRAADAKAYYEEIFQNMIEKHGKLKRFKKTA